ncbi:MAG TPA: hypothetical protein VF025_00545 [Gaiellaceae bacterium]
MPIRVDTIGYEAGRDQLIADSQHHGMGHPPQIVLDQLRQKNALDAELVNASNYQQRLNAAAAVYDHMAGGNRATSYAHTIKGEHDAERVYRRIRGLLFDRYYRWNRVLHAREDAAVNAGK